MHRKSVMIIIWAIWGGARFPSFTVHQDCGTVHLGTHPHTAHFFNEGCGERARRLPSIPSPNRVQGDVGSSTLRRLLRAGFRFRVQGLALVGIVIQEHR